MFNTHLNKITLTLVTWKKTDPS